MWWRQGVLGPVRLLAAGGDGPPSPVPRLPIWWLQLTRRPATPRRRAHELAFFAAIDVRRRPAAIGLCFRRAAAMGPGCLDSLSSEHLLCVLVGEILADAQCDAVPLWRRENSEQKFPFCCPVLQVPNHCRGRR